MTVSSATATATYTGNGATTAFTVPFYFLVDGDVKISQKSAATGVVSVLTLTTDYSLTGAGSTSGGTATLVTAPATGDTIYIERNVSEVQETSYPEGGPFPAASHEKAMDRLTMIAQQNTTAINLKLGKGALDNFYDAGGNLLSNMADGVAATDAATKGQMDIAVAAAAGGVLPSTIATYADLASTAAGKGAALVGFLQLGTGAVPRTVQDELWETVRPEQFGAKFDGVTDDTTAIQDAITYLKSLTNGGYLVCPAGASVISATIIIDQSNIGVIGKGAGKILDYPPTNIGGTQFLWSGAAGGTMFSIGPAGGATAPLNNCDFFNIQLIGQSGAGNRAAIGLNVSSCCNSQVRVTGNHFSYTIVNYTISSGLTEASDCQLNDIWVYGYQEDPSDGSFFVCDAPTVSSGLQGNFSNNRVWQIAGNHYNGNAVVVKGADNNDFYQVMAYRAAGGTAQYGLELTDSTTQATRANTFWHVSSTAEIAAGGTTYPSVDNNIIFLDKENGTPDPVYAAGATLWWGSNHAPIGMRETSALNVNYNRRVWADGTVEYSGYTASIPAGGNLKITFPTPFPSGAKYCTASPYQSATDTWGTALTVTDLTIYNTGSVAAQFWWKAEGI